MRKKNKVDYCERCGRIATHYVKLKLSGLKLTLCEPCYNHLVDIEGTGWSRLEIYQGRGVVCPHCGTLHYYQEWLWDKRGDYEYYWYRCPNCGREFMKTEETISAYIRRIRS